MAEPSKRSEQQRKAIEVFCKLLAETLNDAGLDQHVILAAKCNKKIIRLLEKAESIVDDEAKKLIGQVKILVTTGPAIKVKWTQWSVKEYLWKPIQAMLYGKRSTTELGRTEVSEVHEELMRIMGEHYCVDYIDFPHEEDK